MAVLLHTPARILQALLVTLAVGTDRESTPSGSWPIFSPREPDSPDECITCRTTSGTDDGSDMITGDPAEHPGVQIRVRSRTASVGFTKAQAIHDAVNKTVYRNSVTIEAATYRVQNVWTRGNVIDAGVMPSSQRHIHTVNVLMTVTRTA